MRAAQMFYERRIDSFAKLMREIRLLDSDAGIRLVGSFGGKECLLFLSRSPSGYATMVYTVVGKKVLFPGERVLSKEFAELSALERFLRETASGKLNAFVY